MKKIGILTKNVSCVNAAKVFWTKGGCGTSQLPRFDKGVCAFVWSIILAIFAGHCFAAPFAEWLEGRSPSGAAVRIWAEGDEYSASFEAEDGHAVVFDSKSLTYFYAQQDGDGALVSTGIAVGDETVDGKAALASIPLHLRDRSQAAAEERARRIAKVEEELGMTKRWEQLKETARERREFHKKAADGSGTGLLNAPPSMPTLGTVVGLTILVDFPIVDSNGVVTNTLAKTYHPNVTPENLNELINGENCTLYGNASSVRKYYEDVSCGNLSYTNIVLGWFTAAHPREYYDDSEQDNGPSARELIGEVFVQIANDPDYSTKYLPLLRQVSYSGSYFRALNVWFAGPSAQVWSKGLWAHKWNLLSSQRNLLPVKMLSGVTKYFNTYQISPVTSSPSIGTFCHENGHMICGFPDLYDYDYGNGGPAGAYSLMSSSGGKNPGYVDAYLRAAAGWVEPCELPSEPALITVSNRLDCVWRHSNPSNHNEYYLIENRQKNGRDSNIPGGGILIWRCDEAGNNTKLVRQSGFEGAATNRFSAELSLEQADGLYELERRIHTSDANDLWFYGNSSSGYRGVFNADTVPCAKWRNASNAGIYVSNFSAKGDVMTFLSGDPLEYERPLVVSLLKSKSCSSMTFEVQASSLGKDASRLLVYADIESVSNNDSIARRSDYLGDIQYAGVKRAFTVSGLQIGVRHTVKLRFIQVDGAGAVVESPSETLFMEIDSSIANALGAPEISFWHDSDTYRWHPTAETYHSSPSSVVSGNQGVHSSKSILHAGVTGPGVLSFQWKVSSESVSFDWLEVSFDGSTKTNKIGGTSGSWSPVELKIPEGEHVVTWIYRKDSSVNNGEDSGWIDSVTWEPDPEPLAVVTDSIPAGKAGTAYSTTLTAYGGEPPYRWSDPQFLETLENHTSLPAGTAQGFKGDEKKWAVSLPFEFPFFDGRHSSVWIQSNGALTFDKTLISYNNISLSALKSHKMIAPLCGDLDTSSGDIYVASSSSEVTIRWDGIYYNSTDVSFAVTLYADGTIRMRYGSGNANGGLIGLSDGSGSNYVLSKSSQSGSMSGANDIVFRPTGLPTGMILSEGGVLSGTPSEIGSHQFSVAVEDANGTTATKSLVFVVENSGTSTDTTPVPVPHVWLNSYPGLLSSSGGDYEAMANAQSPGSSGVKKWPDGSPCYVWQDFVAGTSPTNDTVFTATIRMDGTTPVVEWSPDLNENGRFNVRNYTIWGKTNLTDNVDWMCPTNSGHRFFKVKVEMP